MGIKDALKLAFPELKFDSAISSGIRRK